MGGGSSGIVCESAVLQPPTRFASRSMCVVTVEKELMDHFAPEASRDLTFLVHFLKMYF